MGLFVTEDGHFQGWLAAFLCCCAAVSEDESPSEKEREQSSAQVGVCNQQPLPIAELPATPLLARPKVALQRDSSVGQLRHIQGISDRPPSLKPLDFGDLNLPHRWSWYSRQKATVPQSNRPVISAPYAFRRLDYTEAQGQSLVPLRLGPVVLRESPVPAGDVVIPSESCQPSADNNTTETPLSDVERPQSYRQNRESKFVRCQQRSSTLWPLPSDPVVASNHRHASSYDNQRATRPRLSPRSSSCSSLRQREGVDGSLSHSLSCRPSSERLRPRRSRSSQSIRSGADLEIDKEIHELNTIVEERRAEAHRDNVSDEHVAAVAPSMQVRARAETLDAIGSALSRPVTAREYYRAPAVKDDVSGRPDAQRTTSATSRASSRISGWLSGVFPSSPATHASTGQPFYQCQPSPRSPHRTYSDHSMCSSVTELESPSLTAASSPTSKGHSRSQTEDSRIASITPSAVYYTPDESLGSTKKAKEEWPVALSPTNQVGLAL